MTQTEFDNHAWSKSDKVVYENQIYQVVEVDFVGRYVGIAKVDGVTKIAYILYHEIELVNKLEK